jgi:hypothetical protein
MLVARRSSGPCGGTTSTTPMLWSLFYSRFYFTSEAAYILFKVEILHRSVCAMFLPLSCAHLDLVFVAQSATPVDQYHSQAYRSTDFFVDA